MRSERRVEHRLDDRGRFDELIARKPDTVVVETLTGKSVYIGFYWDDGQTQQLWINSDKRLQYHVEPSPPAFMQERGDE